MAMLGRFEFDCEMAEDRRLLRDAKAAKRLPAAIDILQDLDYIIDVALRVRAAGDREPHQVHVARNLCAAVAPAEHGIADLAATNPPMFIDGRTQALCRKLRWRNMRQQSPGIEIDRMAA